MRLSEATAHRRIIDDAIDDHLGDGRLDRDRVRRDLGDEPSQLLGLRQTLAFPVNAEIVFDQRCLHLPCEYCECGIAREAAIVRIRAKPL